MTPEDLWGAWELVEFEIAFSDGRPSIWPFGTDAIGMITYTPSGHMSAVLSHTSRIGLGVDRLENTRRASSDFKVMAFDSYLSYAGRFSLEGDDVIHHVDFALSPDLVGQDNRRHATLEGDLLHLRYDITPKSGVIRHYHLTWKRMP